MVKNMTGSLMLKESERALSADRTYLYRFISYSVSEVAPLNKSVAADGAILVLEWPTPFTYSFLQLNGMPFTCAFLWLILM